MVSPEILANNIRLLRTSKNISQEDVAETILIARTTYSEFEACSRTIDMRTLDALASIHNVSLDSLLNHDLSEGVINRILFSEEHKDTAALLNSYQSLSISSKYLVSQMLDLLLDRETALYRDNLKPNQYIKKDTP